MSETQDPYGDEPVRDHAVDADEMIPPPDNQPEPQPARGGGNPPPPIRNSRTANRDMPASEEAEQHVIACCLLDGAEPGAPTLQRALLEGIRSESFYWPANQTIFQTITDLNLRNQPVSLETLIDELQTTHRLEQTGGLPYLMQVTGKIPTTAHAGYFIEKVREKALLRATIRTATQTIEEAYNFTGGLAEFLQVAAARQDAIRTGTDLSHRAEAEAKLFPHRIHAATPPKEPTTRLFLANKPICTAGNITTIISKAKTGKTAALGAATAAIIAATTSTIDRDTFKFRASNPSGHAVIVIDTEQSPYDAYLCYKRALARAGHEADPGWLHHYSLVGYSPKQLLEALDILLATCAKTHHGIFALILDGVADFVLSVNDEAECNGFVTHLRSRTVAYDCPALCVIHSNESDKSGDDGRGHLGKQLIRKAESNLLLKKTGDITLITSDKQRKAPITEADAVAFQWSDDSQMHVSCGAPESAKRGRTPEFTLSDIAEFLPKPDQPHAGQNQLFRIASSTGIKKDAFNRLLERERQVGSVDRIIDPKLGPCFRLAR